MEPILLKYNVHQNLPILRQLNKEKVFLFFNTKNSFSQEWSRYHNSCMFVFLSSCLYPPKTLHDFIIIYWFSSLFPFSLSISSCFVLFFPVSSSLFMLLPVSSCFFYFFLFLAVSCCFLLFLAVSCLFCPFPPVSFCFSLVLPISPRLFPLIQISSSNFQFLARYSCFFFFFLMI